MEYGICGNSTRHLAICPLKGIRSLTHVISWLIGPWSDTFRSSATTGQVSTELVGIWADRDDELGKRAERFCEATRAKGCDYFGEVSIITIHPYLICVRMWMSPSWLQFCSEVRRVSQFDGFS